MGRAISNAFGGGGSNSRTPPPPGAFPTHHPDGWPTDVPRPVPVNNESADDDGDLVPLPKPRKTRETKKGANKKDSKQVNDAAKDAGIPNDRRRDFGKFIEDTKRDEGRGGRDNFDYDELKDLAKEFKDTQCP